eukprot:TRINITY_DN4080_c0_g1_i1.p2 TRINITY_DN4080_c0_g1~~TRINITY_DN4080_c0_g1_i1.p2  ORF type:complete len:244 (+),score=12.31 TRINITY_DN4080_c0_g1_i1:111-734(+)
MASPMEPEKQKVEDYFNALNGVFGWDKVEPLFDKLYHKELRVTTHRTFLTWVQWKDVMKAHVDENLKATLVDVSIVDDTHLSITVTYHLPTGDLTVETPKARFEDSRLIEDEPSEPAALSTFCAVGQNQACSFSPRASAQPLFCLHKGTTFQAALLRCAGQCLMNFREICWIPSGSLFASSLHVRHLLERAHLRRQCKVIHLRVVPM